MIGRSEYTKTRSGLIIGSAFVERPPAPSRDAEFLQSALLNTAPHYAERVLDFLERHTVRVALWIIASAFVIGAVKGLVR